MGKWVVEFAGGGGSSQGIKDVIGRDVDIARNHCPLAIAMHLANHPGTLHFQEDVWKRYLPDGDEVEGAWFSPDCRHFSSAKGAVPVKKDIRGLAWSMARAARAPNAPRVMFLENVREFETWGPLIPRRDLNGDLMFYPDGTVQLVPDPTRKGQTFRKFVATLRAAGYVVEWCILDVADYGIPQHRRRLFLIARRDGLPICWPEATHGPGRALPWRSAAECIDWSLPCASIFDREPALCENTMHRIAKGLERYVFGDANPFVVTCNHGGEGFRGHSVAEPFKTICGSRDAHGLVVPWLVKHFGGVVGTRADKPFPTQTACGTQTQLGAAYLIHMNHGVKQWSSVADPLRTIVSNGHARMIMAYLVKYYGTATAQDIRNPLGTVTSRARFGLVIVQGEPYRIVDIGMRMFGAREYARAQGFDDSYILTGTKTSQIARIGNSVPPAMVAAIVRANVPANGRRAA